MPGYATIADVGDALKKLLQDGLNQTFGDNVVLVTLDSPKKIEEEANTNRKMLSVYLYKVLENPDLKNQPMSSSPLNVFRSAPLMLDSCYMVTPYGNDEADKAKILGRAMQILYDHALLQGADLVGGLEGTGERVKISLNPLPQELVVQVWQALEASMRVAVFYHITPVAIDSQREISTVRVVERIVE